MIHIPQEVKTAFGVLNSYSFPGQLVLLPDVPLTSSETGQGVCM